MIDTNSTTHQIHTFGMYSFSLTLANQLKAEAGAGNLK